jgi:hypothetical protein
MQAGGKRDSPGDDHGASKPKPIVVIKIGSSSLIAPDTGVLDRGYLGVVAAQLAALVAQGCNR